MGLQREAPQMRGHALNCYSGVYSCVEHVAVGRQSNHCLIHLLVGTNPTGTSHHRHSLSFQVLDRQWKVPACESIWECL